MGDDDLIERLRGRNHPAHMESAKYAARCDACFCRWPCPEADSDMERAEAADEIERLSGLLANVVCPNCGDRACMDCCGRYEHDKCEHDCPVCCEDQPRLTVTGYPLEAWRARRVWLLENEGA